MSSFIATGVLFALAIGSTYAVMFFDRILWDRFNWIFTGTVRGVPISIKHRRLLVLRAWLLPILALTGYQFCITLGWMVAARSLGTAAVAEEVMVLGYLGVFFGAIGVLFLGYQAAFGYVQLGSVLRQAEAD
jgi:hypothetical protein